MLNQNFVFLAVLLTILGGSDYVVQTLKGKAQPNRVTWFLWALAPLIAFFAELSKGVGITSIMTFMVGFIPILVLISSFISKKASWKLTTFDLACGGLSLVGLFLWQITQEGNIAIIFSILSDALASTPTIIKSYTHPETESSTAYLLWSINGLITLLSIQNWSLENFGFPLYIFLLNLLIFILVKFKVKTLLH